MEMEPTVLVIDFEWLAFERAGVCDFKGVDKI
jgi:hypothetical protein